MTADKGIEVSRVVPGGSRLIKNRSEGPDGLRGKLFIPPGFFLKLRLWSTHNHECLRLFPFHESEARQRHAVAGLPKHALYSYLSLTAEEDAKHIFQFLSLGRQLRGCNSRVNQGEQRHPTTRTPFDLQGPVATGENFESPLYIAEQDIEPFLFSNKGNGWRTLNFHRSDCTSDVFPPLERSENDLWNQGIGAPGERQATQVVLISVIHQPQIED